MKHKRIKIKVVFAALALMMVQIGAPLVSAGAKNGISFDPQDGEVLKEGNVTVDPQLIEGLTPIIDNGKAVVDNPDKWEIGYVKTLAGGEMKCLGPYKYFKIHQKDVINEKSGYSWTIEKGRYKLAINITDVELDDRADTFTDENFVTVYLDDYGNIDAGFRLFTNSTCEHYVDNNVKGLDPREAGLYIQTKLMLYDKETNTPFSSNQLYFGITDIDSAQAYKILNPGNELSPENMYVLSDSDIQPTEGTLKNMYSPSGKFVYAQYNGDDGSTFNIETGKSNIYVKVDSEAQRDGLDVVFGFLHGAGSGVRYYAKQYVVKYVSDENGVITGVEDEDVISGDHPSGSASKANTGYRFTHWTVDKKVQLEDGTFIEAGKTITAEQIKQVIVNEDLVFTAYHVPRTANELLVEYKSDEHGKITGIESEEVPDKGNPAGSESEPKENYEFVYWVADKNVALKDGTEILAGKPITPAQVKEVVVEEDLVFTAIHEAKEEEKEDKEDIVAPDTGMVTGETNGMQVTISIVVIMLGAMLIALMPKFMHKKISFRK